MNATAARKAEIARRYRTRPRERPSQASLRIADLRRLFASRYGRVLPDDDAGRDDAFVMACHIARRPDAERRIKNWLELQAPWMPVAEMRGLITRVIAKPYRWRADKLAVRLNLTDAERTRLQITTIGACDADKAERAARRRRRAKLRKELHRRAKGAKPRTEYEANSISRNKPWEVLGMSRATWYRQGKPTP